MLYCIANEHKLQHQCSKSGFLITYKNVKHRLLGRVYLGFWTFLNPNWANHRSSLGKVNLYHPENVWSNSTDTTKHILVKLIKVMKFQHNVWLQPCHLMGINLLLGPNLHNNQSNLFYKSLFCFEKFTFRLLALPEHFVDPSKTKKRSVFLH